MVTSLLPQWAHTIAAVAPQALPHMHECSGPIWSTGSGGARRDQWVTLPLAERALKGSRRNYCGGGRFAYEKTYPESESESESILGCSEGYRT